MVKKIDYNKVNRESLEKVQYDLIAMLQNETSNIRGNHNPCCNYYVTSKEKIHHKEEIKMNEELRKTSW